VRSTDDVRRLLHSGADKVAMNSVLMQAPEVVERCANEFGVQCVVASIDARATERGHEVLIEAGTRATGMTAPDYARRAEALGAGEILLTSMDRDGMMDGYDLSLIESVCEAVDIPVIACGGAGEPQHFVDAVLEGGADAVSAASIFHFTRYTPDDVKRHMKEAGLDVRL
jgi:cyclase